MDINDREGDVGQSLFELTEPSAVPELLKLRNYIAYQAFNYKLYGRLNEYRLYDGPLVGGHPDIPLKYYVLGLVERNRLLWKYIDMEHALYFCKGKDVLDYGCGGCFYADYMSRIAKRVFAYDRVDVKDFVRDNITLMPNVTLHTVAPEPKADVVFVSEVFHGDSVKEIKEQVLMIKSEMLKKGGILVVNELLPGTVLSKHFTTQMNLHTSGGKLYSPTELVQAIGFKDVWYRQFNYHFMIGGKI